jgi:hypothetical protein
LTITNERRAVLTELTKQLHRPMSIADTERVEEEAKAHLREIFRERVSDDDARFLAQWQRDLGFVLKYKPYGVKCASPLGYAVFLLNPGEGFSFQRHLTHKTEIFHIIEPLDGALVYLCTSAEWEGVYERERFQRWLDGADDAEIARFAKRPSAGDVFHVSELGVVHTVLGCILEEFATVSTDMVDRLHDQNEGRESPQVFREDVLARLRTLGACAPRIPPADPASAGVVVHDGTVQAFVLSAGAIDATRVHADRARFALRADPIRARSLFTVHGSALCAIGSNDAPAIEVRGGDLLMIAPGVETTIDAGENAAFSIHGIDPAIALV